ncbi:MAG: glycoside-pentoside-hexuronide (GPH):cation symporter [Planctomycetaceae bacterium]|nr:glycoside-pentoside-hexuronide (GPH):cation symporter [Planctomycetaceae bacterium]
MSVTSKSEVMQQREKELGWEKSGPQPGFYKLPRKEIFAYSTVDFAMNMVFQCIMMYVTFFYTDIFGLAARDVALMFLLSRLWDAFNDPLMGTIVERLNPKSSKYRFYIISGAIPFGLAAVLTYTTPELSYFGKLLWAYVTYNFLNMMYTYIIQPYISLASIMTADPDQRTLLQSVRMMFAQAGGVVVALTIPLLSGYFAKFMPLATGYMLTTLCMAVVMVGILVYAYFNVTERIPVTSHEEKPGLREVFNQISHNKPGIIMFFLFLGVYGFITVQGTSAPYYMTYFAKRPDMVAWFAMMNVLPSVVGVPLVPFLCRTIRKRGTVMLGLAFGAIGAGMLYFATPTAIGYMLLSRGVASFGYGILMGILWSIITDPVEYADLNTGKRLTAIVMTLIGLGIKFSMTIGGVAPTLILDYVKYIPNEANQTDLSLAGIRFMASSLPCGVMVVTFIIFALFYDLSEERVADIQHKIAVRDGLIDE